METIKERIAELEELQQKGVTKLKGTRQFCIVNPIHSFRTPQSGLNTSQLVEEAQKQEVGERGAEEVRNKWIPYQILLPFLGPAFDGSGLSVGPSGTICRTPCPERGHAAKSLMMRRRRIEPLLMNPFDNFHFSNEFHALRTLL